MALLNIQDIHPAASPGLTDKPTQRYLSSAVRRVSELFNAQACVMDPDGLVVASTVPSWKGRPFSELAGSNCPAAFQIPFTVEEQVHEMVICELGKRERISPRLASVLIKMILAEVQRDKEMLTRSEIKNKFIYDLLHGNITDAETIVHYAELLGLDLSPPRAVVLVDAHSYIMSDEDGNSTTSEQAQRRAQFIIDTIIRFFHLPDDLICAYVGDGQIAVLKASDRHNLADWAEGDVEGNNSWADLTALKRAADGLLARLPVAAARDVQIGLGRYHPGLTGLAESYADAQAALSLGRRFEKNNRIHCLGELGVVAFVGIRDEQTKLELADHLLSPLNDEPELIETLDHFFAEDCSLSVTAARLFIHRNTLSYRLDKIASLTGLDPRCFDDAVQIRLALMLRMLQSQQPQRYAISKENGDRAEQPD